MFKPTFVQGLAELSRSKPEVVVEKLHRVFGTISKLNYHQVVIAYQTLEATAKVCKFTDCPVIQELKAAILARMQRLGKYATYDINITQNQRLPLRQWYGIVSGLPLSAFYE